MILRVLAIIILFFSIELHAQYRPADSISAYNYYLTAHEHIRNYDYDSAALYFDRSAYIYEQIGMWTECVRSIVLSLKIKLNHQNNDEANLTLEKGLSIAKKHFKNDNASELTEMVNLVRYKGILYKSIYNLDEALKYYRLSSDYNQKLKNYDTISYLNNESRILLNFAIAYMDNRKKDLALDYLFRALQIQKSLPLDPEFNIAILYINIGNVHNDHKDFESAKQYYLKAKESNNPRYNNYLLINSYVSSQLGELYFNLGKYDESLKYYQDTQVTALKIFGENDFEVAENNSNLASAYLQVGDFNKSIECINSAIEVLTVIRGNNSIDVADAYFKLGDIYCSTEDYINAEVYFNKALEIYKLSFGPKHYYISNTNISLGDIQVNLNNYENALQYYQNAIIASIADFNDINIHSNPLLTNNVQIKPALLNSLQKKADLLYKLYLLNSDTAKLLSAFKTYELSFELANDIRQDYSFEEDMMNVSESLRPRYNNAINAIYDIIPFPDKKEYSKKLFELIEAAKSSALFFMIQESDAVLYSGIPESLVVLDKSLKKDLTFFKTQLDKFNEQKEPVDTNLVKLYEQRYLELFLTRDSLNSYISENYPSYLDRKFRYNFASVNDLQEIINENSAILEYYIGDSNLYINILTKKSYQIKKVDLSELQLYNKTIRLYRELRKWGDKRTIYDLSHELYEILVKPIEHLITDKEKLIIIPDEFLFYLPFEVLCSKPVAIENNIYFSELNYLINDFEISYHYSSSLWKKCIEKSTQNKARSTSNSLCAFAPVFSQDNTGITQSSPFFTDSKYNGFLRSVTVDGKNLSPLPYSKKEVDTLIKIFSERGLIAKSFLFADASEEQFKKNVKNFEFIHIATHGFSNDQNPNLSGLVFSQSPSQNAQLPDSFKVNNERIFEESNYYDDGILHTAEMYNLDLNANLVVLSACETGIGKLRTGEGMMAMTRGFIYAGVPNTIFSLWKVSDIHTHQLMITLYNEILNGNSYSKSLRNAKISMIKNESTAFPGLWSGFLLSGQ